ncbi:hypothetical protein FG386_003221 [Cryptosporidium ryanae]|uniref:uncharacterized protein n=1 Tax=Cryptosporidium ryanae TaxID=515981 RepID=UPI00351A1CAF|nr:hypothetical protein FG386_003221 [Cryptosporidium ryanae]
MKRKSLVSQSLIDPNTFFYYNVDKLNIGIYNAVTPGIEITNSANSDFIFDFAPCKEIENSIFLDDCGISPFLHFNPTFSWSSSLNIGAFTTGYSKYINVLKINKEVIHINKIGTGDTYHLNLDWNSAENNSNLLLSCELISSNNKFSENHGVLSVFDLNVNKKKVELGEIKSTRKNRLGYPICGKWIDSNCIVSSWKNSENIFFTCLNDIRTNVSAIEIKGKKCTNYISIDPIENVYLLLSDMNDIIEITDIRSLKTNNANNDINPLYGIEFESDHINFLSWFPFEKNHISICTDNGVFVVSMNSIFDFQQNLDLNSHRTKMSSLRWNKSLLTYFEPIKLESSIEDGFCWCNKLVGDGNGKYPFAYIFEDSLNYISNLDFTINSFLPFNTPPFFSMFGDDCEIRNKCSTKIYKPPQLLGYSWIPYRLIKYFSERLSKIEKLSCFSLLLRWQTINCEEAQIIVREYKKDLSILQKMGIYVDSVSEIFDIIKLMKSASYTFNVLSILPNRVSDLKEIIKQIHYCKNNKTNSIDSIDYKFEDFFFPGYKDIVDAIKGQGNSEETIYRLKFIKTADINYSFEVKTELVSEKFKNIEVFSSGIREKLVSSFGISLNVTKKHEHKGINDISIIEHNLLTFLWNCITLKYPVFLSQCNYISELLNNNLENEFKQLKLSFMNNLVLFLNSVGIIITNLYNNSKVNNLDKNDISFYHSSIVSTSEQLLDDEYYLPIWNCNIFLESTLQLSIRFLVVVINYLYLESEELKFSDYLLENLFIPCLNLESYIYIPSHLLIVVSLYYLPINSISNLIEMMILKMSNNGLLDCIYIIGLQDIQRIRPLENFDEKLNVNGNNIVFSREDYSKKGKDISKQDCFNVLNSSLSSQRYDGTKYEDIIEPRTIIKNLLQKFLSISFGDIQTISLFGSCFLHYCNNDSFCAEYVEIINKCIDEYRKLLKNNSAIVHSINSCEPIDKPTYGYITTKLKLSGSFVALYELNILSSTYLLTFEEKGLEIPFFSAPSGNTIYCYYCEQPLTQKYCEPNNIVSGISNLNRNSHGLQKESEVNDNNDFQKHFQLVEQDKVGLNIGSNKNLSNISPIYQHDGSMSSEVASIILNCPNKFCNKPLARCVICLSEMSVNSVSRTKNNLKETDFCAKPDSIENWYSWCLYCHHGGCLKHINEWFECFDECPVPECNCWCNVADPWFNL